MSFDLQVNGYAGTDFNADDLNAHTLHRACEALRNDGVNGILATLITDDLGALKKRLQRLVRLREADALTREVITGFHLEGPFINPTNGFRGTHPQEFVTAATPEKIKPLLDAANGLVRLVTLAPEWDEGFKTTRFLSDNGVAVAAGHCNASLAQLRGAIDAGLSLFTHLGNGCPLEMNRHDNIVQRALILRDDLWICFIADGVHVPFFALDNYFRSAGLERCVVVTDAIAPAGLGPGNYTLGRLNLNIGDDMVARAPQSSGGAYLAGSAITMPQTIARLEAQLHLDSAQIRRLTHDNPRAALGLS